ncbi:MAG TPA: CBS domain-containing protein [Methylomirabilota bacterium]|jgi:CBS domain-containing protein|nr:CBS domain-containing protein [Methylomirabilota bacterium]
MVDFSVRPWINGAPLTIGPKENLQRAQALLRSGNVRELLVVDEGKLIGMLNEHDIWTRCPTSVVVLEEQQANELLAHIRVGGVMILHPPVVTPDTSLREAIQLLADSARHGLPVVENGVVVGILTEERTLQAIATVLSELEHSTARQQE